MKSMFSPIYSQLCLMLLAGLILPASFTHAQNDLPESVLQDQQSRVEVIAKASPTVVAIFPPSGAGGGSGVLISPQGLALTNFHVVKGAGPFLKCGLNDGKIYDAVVIGIDPTGDVAIIKLLGRDDFPAAPMGDSDLVKAGDWAFAMGNPFLLAADFTPTLTYGMISGVKRYQYPAGTFLEYTDCLQVDTSINPGNSGGPLFNTAGEVIGINGRISVEKRGRVNAGAGYAISINQIKNFSDHLLSGRVVDHATLGATVRTDEFSNVVIESILASSDAALQGLRSGDEIVTFGGRVIGSVNQFKNALGIYPKGWKVPLTYRRDGQRFDIVVRLAALHSTAELLKFSSPPLSSKKKKPRKIPIDPKNKKPIPLKIPLKKAPQVPKKYAHLYKAKQGFTNYYFNELHQKRLNKQFQAMGNFKSNDPKWILTGKVADDSAFTIKILDSSALVDLPGKKETHLIELDRDETFLAGPNNEGMLMAFCQLRLMVTTGRDAFSEYYYIGSEPLDGTGPRVDILATLAGRQNVRWYFDKQSQQLLGWDSFTVADFPECRIRVKSWAQDDGYAQPTQWSVSCSGKPTSVFRLEKMIIEPGFAIEEPVVPEAPQPKP